MDVGAYLQRIDYTGPLTADLETLSALHRAHLLAVPFENLDIGRGVPIVLDIERLYAKIVGRGGFCYELNGMFSELLRALGYEVTLLSARVFSNGTFGPDFDHLTLRVTGGSLTEPYLADVGYGDSFMTPMRLTPLVERTDEGGSFRLVQTGEAWVMQTLEAGEWLVAYDFTLIPRAYSDFEGMCHFQQISPESSFTRRRVCTQATPQGRVTLTANTLIITRGGERTEQPVADQAAFDAALREHFGIVLTPLA